MTGQAGKLEKVCQKLLLEFLEILRFVVQALQPEKERTRPEIAGLRSELAVPKGLMNTMDIAPTKPDMGPSP